MGADLVVIESEDENQFVYNLLRNISDNLNGWIGLYRKDDNKFYWVDDRPEEANYRNWAHGEPNNYQNGENCVSPIVGDSKGRWNDVPCSIASYVAVCQRPI